MKYILIILGLLWGCAAVAQNQDDVLRYSFHNSFSTARSAGMGGAFGALGADLSALNSNPAGLGLYRRGDFSFTPNIGGSTSSSSFSGEDANNSDAHLKVNSLGFVITQGSDKSNVQKSSFGIAYNRTANFNSDFTISGLNSNSLLDVFANAAQSINYLDIYEQGEIGSILAWDAFLIDTISGTVDQYQTPIPAGGSEHEVTVERNGGMGEWLIGGGVNVNDRFYWGASLGFPVVRFTQESTHKETPKNTSGPLDSFTYTETFEVSGGGINAKIGFIIKASQKLRLGAAYHTRTTLSLNDTFSNSITANFQGNEITPEPSIGAFDYRIVIPSRLMANAAFIAGKNALISADYEFVNYSTGKLREAALAGGTVDFSESNQIVEDNYRETHNIRVGAEFRIATKYRLRFGTRVMQNPYSGGVLGAHASGSIITYNVGAGLRKGSFYADVAGMFTQRNTEHFMYHSSLVNAAQITTNRVNILITAGLRI